MIKCLLLTETRWCDRNQIKNPFIRNYNDVQLVSLEFVLSNNAVVGKVGDMLWELEFILNAVYTFLSKL